MGAAKIDAIRERQSERGEYRESVIFLGVLTVWGQQQPSRAEVAAAAPEQLNKHPASLLRSSLSPTHSLEVFVESCFAARPQTADATSLEPLPLYTSLLFLPLFALLSTSFLSTSLCLHLIFLGPLPLLVIIILLHSHHPLLLKHIRHFQST